MKRIEQTLLEQMRITDFDIAHRKTLLSLTDKDIELLKNCKSIVESKIDSIVANFYKLQTEIPEIALLIGDLDTFNRLQNAQRNYILDLFSGLYDMEYVNNRLRIGLVHKRIGVEPKLYLSAINNLKYSLIELISNELSQNDKEFLDTLIALDKLLLFDITLVFETYIRSLVSEIELSRQKSEEYAKALEQKVKERTEELEILARVDSLTGLLSVRYLPECLTRELRIAQRREEPISIAFIDINDFKIINDTQGHLYGDEVLRVVGSAIRKIARNGDSCFRYGGDEFCLILPNCREDQAEKLYRERLYSEIKKHHKNINLSIGIIQTGPIEFGQPEALIHQADQKMYKIKKESKPNNNTSQN